jgi:hypothetical protein
MLDDILEKKPLSKDRISAGDLERNAPNQTQASAYRLNSHIILMNLSTALVEFLIVRPARLLELSWL